MENWFDAPAAYDLRIQQRTTPTSRGGPSLRYFDGATMFSYQYPSKGSESAFSQAHPDLVASCNGRHGLDPEVPELPMSTLVAKANISSNAYSGISESVHPISIPPNSFRLINSMTAMNARKGHLDLFAGDWLSRQVRIELRGFGSLNSLLTPFL